MISLINMNIPWCRETGIFVSCLLDSWILNWHYQSVNVSIITNYLTISVQVMKFRWFIISWHLYKPSASKFAGKCNYNSFQNYVCVSVANFCRKIPIFKKFKLHSNEECFHWNELGIEFSWFRNPWITLDDGMVIFWSSRFEFN